VNLYQKKYALVFATACWWIFWAAVQTLVMLRYGIPLRESLIDATATGVVLACLGFDITMMVKYFKPSAKNAFYIVIASVVLAGLGCVILGWGLKQFPLDDDYLTTLHSTMPIRFVFIWLMTLILGVQGKVWWFIKEQNQSELRNKETERLMREAELSNLRQQLQPHFLFNSLNSINALIGSKPNEARQMVQQLSDFLRGTLKKDEQRTVSLREEVAHLKLYLAIEKVRFGHRLNTDIQINENTLDKVLPPLLLQPVVENAIKFGLYDTIGEITISLSSKAEPNYLVIEVQNPFDPATQNANKGTGFGLSSIKRRLYLLYARNDLIQTQKTENIFTTTLRIPQ